MRALATLALCMFACTASFARPFTVDDLLGLESYGQTFIVAKQDLVLVERRRPYAQAPDFAYDTYFNSRITSRIMATSLIKPGHLMPMFPQSPDAGYWIGSISPARTMASVFRLEDRKLTLGIVDLATRTVRWLATPPDMPSAAPAPVWVDERHIAYVAMTRPRLPVSLLAGTAGTRDLTNRWVRQARGEVTRTLVTTQSGAMPSDGERQLVLASAIDGTDRVLATGNIVDLSIAPSRRRLMTVLAGDPVQPPREPINTGFDSRRHGLRIIDLVTGRSVAPQVEILRGVMSWSKNDDLMVVMRPGGSNWAHARWSMIDSRGRVRPLGGQDVYAAVEEFGAGRLAYGGWAGSSPIALIRTGGGPGRWARLRHIGVDALPLTSAARPVGATTSFKWMLDGRTLFAVDSHHARRISNTVYQAGPSLSDPFGQGFRLTRDPNTLPMAVIATAIGRQVLPFDGQGHRLPIIDLRDGTQVLAVDDGVVMTSKNDKRALTELSLLRQGHDPVEIDRINAGLALVDLPRAIDLKTISRNGETLHDWLVLPASSTATPPLIVNPYPGLAFTADAPRELEISRYAVSDNALLLAAAGYAVLLPSMPSEATGNPANDLLPRIDAATDAAIATGLVDPERIGLQGHSFGGYAALTVATRSSRYRAIVAANGPYDLFAMHGNMPAADKLRLDFGIPAGASIGWTEGGQGGIGLAPGGAAAYLTASPMTQLDRVRNPVLLITGDLDPVDITQGERAFMELYRQGKDARLARYWGEGHTNASTGNIRDYWQLIIAFFDEQLKHPSMPSTR